MKVLSPAQKSNEERVPRSKAPVHTVMAPCPSRSSTSIRSLAFSFVICASPAMTHVQRRPALMSLYGQRDAVQPCHRARQMIFSLAAFARDRLRLAADEIEDKIAWRLVGRPLIDGKSKA